MISGGFDVGEVATGLKQATFQKQSLSAVLSSAGYNQHSFNVLKELTEHFADGQRDICRSTLFDSFLLYSSLFRILVQWQLMDNLRNDVSNQGMTERSMLHGLPTSSLLILVRVNST